MNNEVIVTVVLRSPQLAEIKDISPREFSPNELLKNKLLNNIGKEQIDTIDIKSANTFWAYPNPLTSEITFKFKCRKKTPYQHLCEQWSNLLDYPV